MAYLSPHYVYVACATIMAYVPPYILLASERAQSCSCSIEISDTYVYIYKYVYIYIYVYIYVAVRQVICACSVVRNVGGVKSLS